jgi:hypothetical protein
MLKTPELGYIVDSPTDTDIKVVVALVLADFLGVPNLTSVM